MPLYQVQCNRVIITSLSHLVLDQSHRYMHAACMLNRLISNKIIALSTVITDACFVGQESTSNHAILVTLLHRPGIGVTELSGIVGLSQPATTRAVKKMRPEGFLTDDIKSGREKYLSLSKAGEQHARTIENQKFTTLQTMLSGLNDAELKALDKSISKILRQVTTEPKQAMRICRHCAHDICKGDDCPVGSQARAITASAETGGKHGAL